MKGMAGTVALATLIGASSEAVIRRHVAREFPVAGRLVDIGDRSIQLDCRGRGAPTVVLEGGLDILGSLSWASVHDSLAATTRVCAYSRAGVLWSEPSGTPFSVEGVAGDLRATLARAGESTPFVMVGHSIGGVYVMKFTERYGADVAGLVFVDASHPDQVARMEAATGASMEPATGPASLGANLSWSGILRLLPANPEPVSAPRGVHQSSIAYLPVSLPALVDELQGLRSSFTATRSFRALGDRPVVVLTAGAPKSAEALKALSMTGEQGRRMQAEWVALQNEQAAWSTSSRHETLADASHYIQFDRPDAVIRAVRDVVGAVRHSYGVSQ